MNNREKLVIAIERAKEQSEKYGLDRILVDFKAVDMILELLKEQEAETGHWIDTTKVIGFPRVRCSVCGSGQGAIWMDYCPNCGAKMGN